MHYIKEVALIFLFGRSKCYFCVSHYGFLYEVKRGFRRVASKILKASGTCFSHIPWCTIDEPI